MSDWQNRLNSEDLRKAAQVADRYAPAFAVAMAVIAVPLALLYLVPVVLGLFAPPLDPKVDLYAVNRPLAFTFLDAQGQEVGHRRRVHVHPEPEQFAIPNGGGTLW